MSALMLIAAILAAGPNGGPHGVLAQRGAGWAALGAMQMPGDVRVDDSDVAGNVDNDLAEVIQTTIAPNSWERAGGRGTIRYWPGRGKPVRTNGNAQSSILDALDQMNRRAR